MPVSSLKKDVMKLEAQYRYPSECNAFVDLVMIWIRCECLIHKFVSIVLNVWNLELTILSITSSTKLAPIAPQNQALRPLAHWPAPPLVLLLPCHWQSLVRVFIFTYLLSLTTILVTNNAGSEVR